MNVPMVFDRGDIRELGEKIDIKIIVIFLQGSSEYFSCMSEVILREM